MGVCFSSSALIIIIIFNIIFFFKKKVNNIETKLYGLILILTALGLFLEIFTFVLYKMGININSLFYHVLSKLTFCYYVVWGYLYSKYIVCLGKNKYRRFTLLEFFTLLSFILIIASKISFNNVGNSLIVPSGVSFNLTLIICVIFLMLELILSFKYRKQITTKKIIPLYTVISLDIVAGIVQLTTPALYLNGYILSVGCIIMYFTIENPDVKMINELELAKKQAEKANAAKSDFLSSMSHEIRTPLNAIVGFSECIKQSDDIAEIHEDIDDVIKASQNLLEIVNGVLDISKIEADKLEIVNVSYNPVEVFNELVKLVSTRIGEKDLEIRCNFAPDIPEVLYGDKSKVKQIVLNLLTNAVKYTDKGYVDLSVSCINKDNKSDLSITVADTGRGIKEEQMSRLFNKFERLEEDRNTTIEGTGLGLAITKALVEMMGGKIIVHSTYGEGSKFTILVSQKISTEGLDTEKKVDTSVNEFEGKKVLVVDDNRLNLRVVDKLLKSYKLNVTLIESGFECINKIENNESYDLIFMDIMMPKMSGVETLKKLKSISRFNIPVVALTADAMEGKSNKYIEVGFNDYLSKPIDKEELKRVLNKFLVKKEYSNEEARSISGSNSDNKVYEAKITDDDIKMLDELLAKSKLEK